jgi:rubrerythrin
MVNVFNPAEVVDIGIQKEVARRTFYDQVANHFDEPEMKDLFTRLRDWEDAHIKTFEKIRDTLGESKVVESYAGEMEAYGRALVDDMLYTEVKPEDFSRNVKTPIEAINYGIRFEKDAIFFFQELAHFIQTTKKDVILRLIEEERQHMVYLIKLKKKLSGQS